MKRIRYPKIIQAKMHQIAMNNSIRFIFKEKCKTTEMDS